MAFSICLLALSLSIDALGVGISYGLRRIKIPLLSALFICMFSIVYSGAAILFGRYLSSIIPSNASKIIGIVILMFMGGWIILQGLIKGGNRDISEGDMSAQQKTLLKIAVKSLGITIQVIRNPSGCDIDKSGAIDVKESLLLGLALSVDAIGVGIGSALVNFHSLIIPFAVGLFQLILLRVGTHLGKRFVNADKVNEKVIAVIPGILLIVLAIIRVC